MYIKCIECYRLHNLDLTQLSKVPQLKILGQWDDLHLICKCGNRMTLEISYMANQNHFEVIDYFGCEKLNNPFVLEPDKLEKNYLHKQLKQDLSVFDWGVQNEISSY